MNYIFMLFFLDYTVLKTFRLVKKLKEMTLDILFNIGEIRVEWQEEKTSVQFRKIYLAH